MPIRIRLSTYFDADLNQDRNRNQVICGSGSATLLKEKEQLNLSGSLSTWSANRLPGILNAEEQEVKFSLYIQELQRLLDEK
jgi:hypothetical protein